MSQDSINFSMFQKAGAPLRSLKAGEAIFREGDPAPEVYCIQSGRVGVYIQDRLLHTLEANGIFGIMSLIEHGPRSDTAIAETDVTLVAVSEKTFLFCVSETPYFALDVMRALVRQLRAELAASPREAGTAAREDDTIDFGLFHNGGPPLRSFKAGDVIFKGGDPATDLYCVQSGRVGLDLGDRRIQTIGPNGIFGIMSLIEHGPRGDTAIAETDVTLAAVSEKTFLFCVSETPYFALNVMRALAHWTRAEMIGVGPDGSC
jgi:CRP/FNR family transcriptional regulator, cyclic AMP receptor protein